MLRKRPVQENSILSETNPDHWDCANKREAGINKTGIYGASKLYKQVSSEHSEVILFSERKCVNICTLLLRILLAKRLLYTSKLVYNIN